MNYKGFNIDYAPRDRLYIISFRLDKHIMEIVGHALDINGAQKMIDFHVSVEESKRDYK